jgi:hypothetical protein
MFPRPFTRLCPACSEPPGSPTPVKTRLPAVASRPARPAPASHHGANARRGGSGSRTHWRCGRGSHRSGRVLRPLDRPAAASAQIPRDALAICLVPAPLHLTPCQSSKFATSVPAIKLMMLRALLVEFPPPDRFRRLSGFGDRALRHLRHERHRLESRRILWVFLSRTGCDRLRHRRGWGRSSRQCRVSQVGCDREIGRNARVFERCRRCRSSLVLRRSRKPAINEAHRVPLAFGLSTRRLVLPLTSKTQCLSISTLIAASRRPLSRSAGGPRRRISRCSIASCG